MGKAKKNEQYLIGIDLGTTNCTMSYTPKVEENHSIELFLIEQSVDAQTQSEYPALPSFIYFPLDEEKQSQMYSVEWVAKRNHCIGLAARERGCELPQQMIASAKSWLCHDGIDRREKILPASESGLMSPLEACSELLVHLREVWDRRMKQAPFVEQQVFVTVPASFDPSARQLVQEATVLAKYPEVILLEEPQAAFYSWLYRHSEDWRQQLVVDDCVLVVDIGGGTTDFSLIKVVDDEGDLCLERVAVGAHLLLGGDNMDLALAHLAKGKLEDEGHCIDEWQLQSLVHSCRQAKEVLFAEQHPDTFDITIHGRGTKLIGGTLSTTITYDEAHALLIEGFVPLVDPSERSLTEKRAGIQQIGLPYAQDPRISCQLAKFLSMTGESNDDTMDHFLMPTAVLFNGGTMKGEQLRRRLVELLNQWAQKLNRSPIKVLSDPDYDYAVSQGGVYYGIARMGQGLRIKGGTSRSYYIGVEGAAPAVPGIPAPLTAVCVVPFGMEEGTEATLTGQEFALVLGELATFRFFSRATATLSDGKEPIVGTLVKDWKKELTELHPVETILDKSETDGKTVRVTLTSKVTELGVLELWCMSSDNRKWKLEFDIRREEEALQLQPA